MQEDINKKDSEIQELRQRLATPQGGVAQELANAKREIEKLKESTSELRRGQEDLMAMSTPDRGITGTQRREKIGKWQEFLETPISVSQRRSRRDTPHTTRYTPQKRS
jgi:DNA repair exonuclease SbcCD ATPase subunit